MNGKTNLNIRLLVWVLVLLLTVQAAVGATIHVPADFNSIQEAINAAVSYDDEIEVAPGTYNEAIDFNGKYIQLYSSGGPDVTTIDANGIAGAYHVVQCVSGGGTLEGFTITGGNANGLVYPDNCGGGMRNYDSSPTVTNCIFTGNAAIYGGGGMYNEGGRPKVTNCIFIRNTTMGAGGGMGNEYGSEPSVTDCNFINNTANRGGGMYNYGSDPTVTNCTFSDNTANSYGGGIYNYWYSRSTVTKCTFIGNEARDGGGMLNENSNPTVTNCTFSDNKASNGGGMLNQSYSHPKVTNCTFSDNKASNGGGMLNQSDSNPTVTNCKFNENEAGNGGGMLNQSSSRPILTHCIFSSNTASNAGGGIYNSGYSSPAVTNCTFTGNTTSIGGGMFNHHSDPTLTNCILWGDTPDEIFDSIGSSSIVNYCDIQGGWLGEGGNNIDADPCFVNASSGDLRLSSPSSACVDAGDSTRLLNERIYLDLDGKHRYVDIDSIVDTGSGPLEFLDIGAYEFNCNYTAGDSNCDGMVDFKDLAIVAGNWLAGTEPK
jgi:parallel beta-helix repeat protein/predicted outer membrane repeat protein